MASKEKDSVRVERDAVGAYLRNIAAMAVLSQEETARLSQTFRAARRRLNIALCRFPFTVLAYLREEGRADHSGAIRQFYTATEPPLETLRAEMGRQLMEASSQMHERLRPTLQDLAFTTTFYSIVREELKTYLRPGGIASPRGDRAGLPAWDELNAAYIQMENASSAILEGTLRMVISIAKRFASNEDDMLDLVQEGNIGLLSAIEKYDPQMGYNFSTYANWWIRQAIIKARASLSRAIRLPMNMIQLLSKIRQAERELVQQRGSEPSPRDLAEHLGMSESKVRALQKMMSQPISLQSPLVMGDTQTNYEAVISDATMVSDSPEMRFLREDLIAYLDSLNVREAEILRMRYGLNATNHQFTLDEIAEHFDISRERIRQLEINAITKLRHPDKRRRMGFG